MGLPWGTFAAMSFKLLAADDLRPLVRPGLIPGNGWGRRGLLSFLLLRTATAAPDATDSNTAFFQEYTERSKENKAKNDEERLDDYYKRNYKDYFEFVEGSLEAKNFLNLRRAFVTGFERTKKELLLLLNDLQTESHLN